MADELLQSLWLSRSVPTDTVCSEASFNFLLISELQGNLFDNFEADFEKQLT